MPLPHLPPPPSDLRARLRALAAAQPGADPTALWAEATRLAATDLSFIQTNALDAAVQHAFPTPPPGLAAPPVRLAVLGSATLTHLLPAIRIGGLRRGLHVTTWEGDFGQYLQTLADPGAGLAAFGPTVLLLALDAHHLAAGASASLDAAGAAAALAEARGRIEHAWRLARVAFRGPILQQTVLALHPPLLGANEHRLAGSPASLVASLNAALRPMADAAGVHLLAIDTALARDGIGAWHNPTYWHLAKQEIAPAAAPAYGEKVGQLLGALAGRSRKCLALDLDNTLWGGVIGDDGLDGIVLGQGSAAGEAFVAFQAYVRDLARRGVILAVCSKNDAANALEPFASHPDMVLRRDDIACFVANWDDKPTNLRRIARELNIGLDALVFVDDNPMERGLVRQELPMVAVPEVTDDPDSFIAALADGGYFEALAVTAEDHARTALYAGNQARDALRETATDLEGYLRGLDMRLVWRRFDTVGLARIVQLINKSNQFNLTTKRYAEEDVRAVMADARAFGLQLRLLDRFGDNGVIAIVIGRLDGGGDVEIDTWLMSCRVLGRQVEPTTLNLIAAQARALGARRLVGRYLPTKKNAMVHDHYAKLGFTVTETAADGASRAELDLGAFVPVPTFIHVIEG
ncbi:MAG: HAD-IIIC family phosphatase [Acetobacteraceae bacterium]